MMNPFSEKYWKVKSQYLKLKVQVFFPQKINLNIVFEDEDLLVLNKSAGLVVHPGAGNF